MSASSRRLQTQREGTEATWWRRLPRFEGVETTPTGSGPESGRSEEEVGED